VVPGGHLAALSRPAELAAALARYLLAGRYEAAGLSVAVRHILAAIFGC
jgi:hypothetical protein